MAKQKPWGMTLNVGDEVIVRIYHRYANPSLAVLSGVVTKRGTQYLTVETDTKYGKREYRVHRERVQDRFSTLQSEGIQLFPSFGDMHDFLLRGKVIANITYGITSMRTGGALQKLSIEQLKTLAGWLDIDITGVE